MKVLWSLFMIYLVTEAALCPNSCSGKGVCQQSGKCDCYPGYTGGDCRERTCPYGHPYIDPQSGKEKEDLEERSNLECSGQGECDRTTGMCVCRIPYEGENCERLMCPNRCSGHGVCRPIKFFDWGHGNDLETVEISDADLYDKWDGDVSFKCDCDKEYTGYDCSERRCKIGYMTALDCEEAEPAVTTVTFELVESIDPTKEATNPPTNGVPNSAHAYLGYLQYYDSFDRVWYSDAFDITNAYSYNYTLYKSDGQTTPTYTKDSTLRIPGWYDVLKSFPPNVIDVATITVTAADGTDISCEETEPPNPNDNSVVDKLKCKGSTQANQENPKTPLSGKITVAITYGASQSGRQSDNINILTMEKIKTEQGMNEGGFHGLKSTVNSFNKKLPGKDTKDSNSAQIPPVVYAANVDGTVSTESRGVPPTECGNNGICNTVTGLCECFTGFYGDACTEQLALL